MRHARFSLACSVYWTFRLLVVNAYWSSARFSSGPWGLLSPGCAHGALADAAGDVAPSRACGYPRLRSRAGPASLKRPRMLAVHRASTPALSPPPWSFQMKKNVTNALVLTFLPEPPDRHHRGASVHHRHHRRRQTAVFLLQRREKGLRPDRRRPVEDGVLELHGYVRSLRRARLPRAGDELHLSGRRLTENERIPLRTLWWNSEISGGRSPS